MSLSFIVFLALILPLTGMAFNVPPLGKSHVVDKARVIDRPTEQYLQGILSGIKKSTGLEMAILTVPSLEGEVLEQATIKVVEQWKLGTAAQDKGLLLFLAIKEKKLRLEVGQGLEGELTDVYSRRIIDDNMVPLLKTGDYNSAITVGSYQALKKALPQQNIDQYFDHPQPHVGSSKKKLSLFKIIVYLCLFIFFITTGRGGLLGFFLGSALGGRGYGGGGFGGGSLGGGGGFSGGGSSGSW